MEITEQIGLIVQLALEEDISSGDVTSESVIPSSAVGQFAITAREDMVLCGAEIAKVIFEDLAYHHMQDDGDNLMAGDVIATVSGNVQEILKYERVALNFLQYMSGIATLTNKFVQAVEGTKAKILDTRKTTPTMRVLEKYAVEIGGGQNHRWGLYDMVLIKDNHIAHAGGIRSAVEAGRKTGLRVEVECDTIEQVKEAVKAKPDVILADNMFLKELEEVVKIVRGRVPIEASGGVDLESVGAIAQTGVDLISTSKITQSAPAVDIGLDAL